MKNHHRVISFITIFTFTLLLSAQSVNAKERCKKHLTKLQKIQSMQRQGSNLKRSQSLRSKEEKARKTWWQCEQSSSKGKVKKKRNVKKVKDKRNKVKQAKISSGGTPFKTTQSIVISNKRERQYSENKKSAWLGFYQQPKKCQRPKNLQIFAYCTENKQQQRTKFEQGYQKE